MFSFWSAVHFIRWIYKIFLLSEDSKALLMVGSAGLDVRLTGRLLSIGSAARFAVPGVRLVDDAAASLTDRSTHCALASSATGSARALDPTSYARRTHVV